MSSEPPVSPDLIQRALRGELSGEQLDRVIVHWRDHPEDIPSDGSVADSLLAAVRDTHTVRDELTSVESEIESLVDRLVQPEFALALTDSSSNGATAAEPVSPDVTFIGPSDAGTIDASTAESGVGDGRSKSPASPSLEATKDSADSSIALVPAGESHRTGGSHQTQRDTGLATPVESELVPGLVLGAYKIIRKLGQGGMGMVFLAEHQRMKRLVALKVLPPQLTRQPAAIQRFQREVQALARLSHPNIVTAFDADEARGLHLLVMEYVDGTDLSVLVKKQGPLPVDRAIDFITQAARGLEYAHKRGMVHRDIKPSNILVDTEGHVKILDLGLARFGDTADVEGQELTGSGMLLGTADYMAPEQAENTKGADARADIYSLGCTLYFLLTGRTLYTGDTVLSRLLAHTKQPIPSLRATVPTVSRELDAVYQRAVAKTPDERYQSVTEFLAALSRVPGDSAGLTISSVGTGSLPRADSPTRAGDSLAGQPAASRAGRGSRPSVKTIGFAAGGAALLLFAVWIIFKDRNNNEVGRVKVDPGQQIPVQTAPGATAVVANTPDGDTPTTPPDQTGWPAGAPQPAIAPFDAAQAAKHQEEWAAYLKVPVEYTNSIGMKFRLIPPGEFLMGSTPDEVEAARKEADPNDKNWQDFIKSEAPRHKVILTRPIYLGTNEVTQTEYEKVMGVNPSHFTPNGVGKAEVAGLKTAAHPVEMVSWYDAAEFCVRLSRLETLTPFYVGAGDAITPQVGNGYRLPSEAEWEFACRAGTTTKRWMGDSDELLPRAGWSSANSGGRTHAAGELNANPFGLFDIQGNVWEWVEDIWDANRYGPFENTPAVNPATPLTGGYPRVFRGGSFIDRAPHLRSSLRFTNAPVDRGKNFGFRVSLSVDAVKAGVRSNGQDIGTPVASPGRTGSVPGHSDPQTQAVRSAQWIDWLSPKVQRGDFDNNPDGWLREGNAVTTNLVIQGIEVLPATTRNAALRLTYLLRDSEGITINARDHKTGELRDLYTAADDGRVLRIRRFRTGSDPILLGEQAISAGVSRDAPRTLEFRVFRNVLTATLNGSTTVRVVDDSLREGNFALVALKGLLVQKVEYQEWGDVPVLAIAPFDAAQAKNHQEEWAAYLTVPTWFTNSIGMKLRLIPPGEFQMGSPDEHKQAGVDWINQANLSPDSFERARIQEEGPQHAVTIPKPFCLGETEVTVGQFRSFVEATKYLTQGERFGAGNSSSWTPNPNVKPEQVAVTWQRPGYAATEDHPVTQVTWADCIAFCNWLSEREGLTSCYTGSEKDGWTRDSEANGYRLPTEAEWEYSCRAGTTTHFSFGDDPAALGESGWFGLAKPGTPRPVAQKLPNPFGLFDLHGNVREWCYDWYSSEYYADSPAVDPAGPDFGSDRVMRGGRISDKAVGCRSAFRYDIAPFLRNTEGGFRVVRCLPPTATDLLLSPDYAWSAAEAPGPEFNSSLEDASPYLSGDGLSMFFASMRPRGHVGYELWESHRSALNEPFGPPMEMSRIVNSIGSDDAPCLSPDGRELLFASNRPGSTGNRDLYVSRRSTAAAKWGAPVNLGATINTPGIEDTPVLADHGLALYFSTNRPSGQGGMDIWRVSRSSADATFAEPVNLGAVVNTSGDESAFAPLGDGRAAVFLRRIGDQTTVMTVRINPRTGGFHTPQPLELPPLDGALRGPHLSRDGLSLYFHAVLPQGKGAFDVWRIRRVPKAPAARSHTRDGERPADALKPAITNRSETSMPRAAWHGWPADAPLPAIAPFDAAQARRHQEEWAAYLKQPVEFTNAIGVTFRLIPPGEFLMGSPDSDPLAKPVEKPQQRVTITKPFYLAVNELTREQFAKFVAATNYSTDAERSGQGGLSVDLATGKPKRDPKVIWKSPGFPQKDTHPVVNISWNDALAFCAWQGENGCRMPTEAEWEFACRAGTLTPYHMGDNAEKLIEFGNVQDSAYKDVFGPGELDINVRDGYVFTAPVGTFLPNPFGLHDVIGNVWEWCADTGLRGYSSEAIVDPLERQPGDTRISRGGAMECWRTHSRSAVRNYVPRDHAAANQGVRVALSIDVSRFFPSAKPATSRWQGWPVDAPRPAIVPFEATLAKSHQEAWAKFLKVPAEYTNSLGMKFRLIPPGEFVMGSSQEEIDATVAVIEGDDKAWKDRVRSEGPRHPVTISRPVYLAVNEVTQAEYEKLVGKNPAHFSATGAGRKLVRELDTRQHPAEVVSWYEAIEFCRKLAAADNLSAAAPLQGEPPGRPWDGPYSLPTEAEWEFAARAGSVTSHWTGADLAALGRAAWYLDHGEDRSHPVGQLEANPFGLCDVYGNVWEWVLDGYEQNHFQTLVDGVVDPVGPNPPGTQRVLKGGAMGLHAMHCRSNNRGAVAANMRADGWGFRLALSVDSVREKLRQVSETTALGFDGAGARVEIADLKWDSAKPLTLEAWCLPAKPSSNGLVIGFSGDCELRQKGRHWWFGVKDETGNWREIEGTADASYKVPAHIAGVWNGSELRLFVDGVRHSEPLPCKPPPFGSVTATLGAAVDGTMPYAGRMLQVRISTLARYQDDFDPAPTLETDGDTVLLYRFDTDTTAGESVPDRSGNNHTGTLRGAKWTAAPRIPGAPVVNPAAVDPAGAK